MELSARRKCWLGTGGEERNRKRREEKPHTQKVPEKVRATRKAEENGGIKLNYNKRQGPKNDLTTATTASNVGTFKRFTFRMHLENIYKI